MQPKINKLYKAINHLGTYWIVAESFDQANDKLLKILNHNNYGYNNDRIIREIHLIAEGIDDPTFITGKFLIE